MAVRFGLFGLFGGLTITGAATAKPPDLPAPPYVEGREPSLFAREFHTADTPTTGFGTLVAQTTRSPGPDAADPSFFEGFVNGVVGIALNRLTIPLGTAMNRE
jgi:hypothetical protein